MRPRSTFVNVCFSIIFMRPRLTPETRRIRAYGIRLAKTDLQDFEKLAVNLSLQTAYSLMAEMVKEVLHLCTSGVFSFPENSRLLQLRASQADAAVWRRLANDDERRVLSKAESHGVTISFPQSTRTDVATVSRELGWSEGQVVAEALRAFCILAGSVDPLLDPPAIILRYRALRPNDVPAKGKEEPKPLSAILFAKNRPKPEPTLTQPTSVRLVKSDLRILRSLGRSLGVPSVNRFVVYIVLEVLHLCASPPFSLSRYRRLLRSKISRDDQATWHRLAGDNILRTLPNPKTQPIRISFPGKSRSQVASLGSELRWSEGQVILEALQTFCILAGGSEDSKSLPGIFRQAWMPRSYRGRTDEDSGSQVTGNLNRRLGLVRGASPLELTVKEQEMTVESGLLEE